MMAGSSDRYRQDHAQAAGDKAPATGKLVEGVEGRVPYKGSAPLVQIPTRLGSSSGRTLHYDLTVWVTRASMIGAGGNAQPSTSLARPGRRGAGLRGAGNVDLVDSARSFRYVTRSGATGSPSTR